MNKGLIFFIIFLLIISSGLSLYFINKSKDENMVNIENKIYSVDYVIESLEPAPGIEVPKDFVYSQMLVYIKTEENSDKSDIFFISREHDKDGHITKNIREIVENGAAGNIVVKENDIIDIEIYDKSSKDYSTLEKR